jgi:hypothetical protein
MEGMLASGYVPRGDLPLVTGDTPQVVLRAPAREYVLSPPNCSSHEVVVGVARLNPNLSYSACHYDSVAKLIHFNVCLNCTSCRWCVSRADLRVSPHS